LHLVRVGSDLVLVGAAEKTVTPIRTYSEHEARRAGLIADGEAPLLEAGEPVPARSAGSSSTGLVDLLRARTVRR
jgi:hypothetical protein